MRETKSWGIKGFGFRPWLPVAASMAIMAMVALVAADDVRHLNHVSQWRRHSADVILSGQSFQNNLLDIQWGMRGYVTLGDTNALASFYQNLAVEPSQLRQLQAFTTDNPAQEARLKALAGAMSTLIAFDYKAIATYQRFGSAGIEKLDESGEGRADFAHARDLLDLFSAEEQRLWAAREASEQRQFNYTGELLVAGSMLAAVLLLLAHYLAGRELKFRRIAEERLRRTMLLQNAILNSVDYGIALIGVDGIVQTFNRAAERLLGYSAEEIVGRATPALWRDPAEVSRHAEMLSKKLGSPVKSVFEGVAKNVQRDSVDEGEWTFIRKDGTRFPCLLVISPLSKDGGDVQGLIGIFRDISDRKRNEKEREELIGQLQQTLAEIKTLSGLIPICAWCKNVRSDTGYWQTVEQYVRNHSEATFSHGVCPTCAARFKDDILRATERADPLSKT